MAWGLEARVPFLDHDLVELAAACPPELKLAEGGKGVLKRIGRRIIPPEVIDRPKGYFPVPAITHLEGKVLDLVRDALASQAGRRPRPLPARVRRRSCWPTRTASSRRCRATSSGSSGCSSSGCRPTRPDRDRDTPRRRAPPPDGRAAAPALTSRSWKQPSEHQVQGMDSDVVLDLGLGPAGRSARPSATCAGSSTRCARRRAAAATSASIRGTRTCSWGSRPTSCSSTPRYTYRLDLHRYRPRAELIRGVFVRTVTSEAEMAAINEIYALQRDGRRRRRDDVAQPPDPRLHLPGRRGPPDREDRRHRSPGWTTRWPSATPRPAPACGAWPCTPRTRRRAPGRRWSGCWPSATSAAGRAYLDLSVMHDNEARDRAVPQARVHPGRRRLRQAQEPDQHPAVRRPPARPGGAQPLRADHRRGGAAPRDPGGGRPTPRAGSCGCRSAAGPWSPWSRCRSSPRPSRMSRCDDKRVTRRIMERAGVRVARGAVACEGDLAAATALLRDVRRGRRQARAGRAGARDHRRGAPTRPGWSGPWPWRCSSAPTCWSRSWCDGRRPAGHRDRPAGGRRRRPPSGRGGRGRPAARWPSWCGRPAGGASGRPAGSRASRWTRRPPRWSPTPGYAMDDVPPSGERIRVRRTANLHTGGTIEDVTDQLHPDDRRGRRPGRHGAGHPGDRASTSWCPTSAGPSTCSSRPTSGPGWPTTSRSRWSSGSSTCCSPRPAAADSQDDQVP